MEGSTNLVSRKLREYFNYDNKKAKEILNELSLLIYQSESESKDLYELAKLLPDEHLLKVVNYFDGATLQIPSKEDFKNCLLLSVVYFLKEKQNWSWKQIKAYIDIPDLNSEISSISLSKKLQRIHREIEKNLMYMISKLDIKDIKEIIREEHLENPERKEDDEQPR